MEEFKSRFDVAALAESMADTIRADVEAWENNTLGSFSQGYLGGWKTCTGTTRRAERRPRRNRRGKRSLIYCELPRCTSELVSISPLLRTT